MTKITTANQLWEEALASFPYPDLKTAGWRDGNLEDGDDGAFYEEEFTFDAGKLLQDQLIARGWLEFSREHNGWLGIVGLFKLYKVDSKESILAKHLHVLPRYDITSKTWTIRIAQY
jgi:hypothetical protein